MQALLLTGALVMWNTASAQTAPTVQSEKKSAEATPQIAATAPPSMSASECDHFVSVLSGKSKDAAAFRDPKLKMVAPVAKDLITCRAIAEDSDELCKLLGEEKLKAWKDVHGGCREQRSVFHELKTYPSGRGYLFPDTDYEICLAEKPMAPFCDKIREAARAADTSKCPSGRMEAFCKAFVAMDEAKCKGVEAQQDCEKGIAENSRYANGLKAIAESAAVRERAFANAALGQADACAPFVKPATQACMAAATAPATPEPVAPTPAKTPAPQQPQQG